MKTFFKLISIAFTTLFFLLCGTANIFGQEVEIAFGETSIGVNQQFTIQLVIKGERFTKYSDFPEIEGFAKREATSSSSTKIIDNKLVSEQRVVQVYMPQREGTFKVKPFQMTANGKTVSTPGTTVKVGQPATADKNDPFEDFWGSRDEGREYVKVDDDAFFAITTNKNSVYVGESFAITVSFYISLKNRATIEFYNISEQLSDILKKIQPENCWEENFGIDQINPEYVVLKGQQYTRYKIYQGAFFPLNTKDIEIPSVPLTMLKFKVARQPSFFGRNMKEDYKTYYSAPKTVRVKELPPHSEKASVNVGNYRLTETLANMAMETGKS